MPCAGGRKAFAEGEQQLGIALKANLSRQQRPDEIPLFRQESEPGLSVGRDMHVRLAGKAILDGERSIPDRDRGLALFRTCEREMEGGVEAPRLVRLEDKGHEVEQPGNRACPETVG